MSRTDVLRLDVGIPAAHALVAGPLRRSLSGVTPLIDRRTIDDMTRTADEVEQTLANLLVEYSVEKGSGWECMPYMIAYCSDVLTSEEQPALIEALRRWLSPAQYRNPQPGQPRDLSHVAVALADRLKITSLIPDLERLADLIEDETPPPRGFYNAKPVRQAADRIRAARA